MAGNLKRMSLWGLSITGFSTEIIAFETVGSTVGQRGGGVLAEMRLAGFGISL
jgi:hypothetical protein